MTLFGLTADSYNDLQRFEGKSAAITDHREILDHVLKDIKMKHMNYPHVFSASEAT
jgi:hypothetical protein